MTGIWSLLSAVCIYLLGYFVAAPRGSCVLNNQGAILPFFPSSLFSLCSVFPFPFPLLPIHFMPPSGSLKPSIRGVGSNVSFSIGSAVWWSQHTGKLWCIRRVNWRVETDLILIGYFYFNFFMHTKCHTHTITLCCCKNTGSVCIDSFREGLKPPMLGVCHRL